MTRQEMFDKAVAGLIAQGRPSMKEETETCKYRGPDGTACAIGMLIDEETAIYWDGFGGISTVIIEDREGYGEIFSMGDYDFLLSLQNVHDTCDNLHGQAFVDQFKGKAKKLAKSYELEWNFN